jgi:ATP-dependent RNA helicase DDX46/PRP5
MLRHILDQPPLKPGDGPIGVIMAPTRELAMQIHAEYTKFCKPLGLQCLCIYGGSGVASQISELKRGAEIVVCTPGRMIDILCTNSGRVTNLKRVTFLVLDEADRMFDMGFEPQIMRIINNIRPDRQTVMFSATFPKHVEALAKKMLHKPVEIVVGGRSVVSSDIEQHVEIIPEDEKFKRLVELIKEFSEKGLILVFVDRQDACDKLFSDLLKAGHPCLSLHGGKDQQDRDFTIDDFKHKVAHVLVATSVAARGLDVKDLNLVVNYDVPNHMEDYVHRVGRTGRAGNKGNATF